jgi:hypothetical protein
VGGPEPRGEEERTVATSVRAVRWLCWALIVLAITNAVITLGFALGIGAPQIDNQDLVDRLAAIRTDDMRIFPVVVLQSLTAVGVFLLAATLGSTLRRWAANTPARDAMVLLFVIGGVTGIAANLINIAVGNAATFGYCDCGYKTEELIAQDYALTIGWNIVNWLAIGAVTMVGVGAAVAGRLLDFSTPWRLLSYAIALLLLLAAAMRLIAAFVFVAAFDPFQVSDLMTALAAGVLVPVWAVLLARQVRTAETPALAE